MSISNTWLRYKAVKNFAREKFWNIHVVAERDDTKVDFNWDKDKLFDKHCCKVIYCDLMVQPVAIVVNVITKEMKKYKPYPLTIVELQKAGCRFLAYFI